MDAFEILVVILSVTLAIFLVTAIVMTLLIIKVVKKVQIIADNAETVSKNIADASNTVKVMAGPTAILQMIAKVIKR